LSDDSHNISIKLSYTASN